MLLIQKQSQILSGQYDIKDLLQPTLLVIGIILISLISAKVIF